KPTIVSGRHLLGGGFGAHGRANALDVLLKAAKIVQDQGYEDIRFVLVGAGPEKPKLIELAEKMQLKDVEFREPVEKTEVPRVLQESDALIFNLEQVAVFKYGISSNKLFDYMASGRPVLFSVSSGNNPVDEAQCGLTVPPRDPKALAEAVNKLYRMPLEEREEMGRRGREYVEKHHSIPVLADKLEAILQEVLCSEQ
ncbi:MAG TPA: glycosyltransferase WbuB, partial [Aquificae bacterium]|nr:glycosyltransferase WbuB [Aquificota bacterium]